MHNYSLTPVSKNSKPGPIAVTYTGADSCPDSCALKGPGCYAESGHTAIHWRELTAGERGTDLAGLTDGLKKLPRGAMVRHNVAGDLPSNGAEIDPEALRALVRAFKRLNGFTYTHHDRTPQNLAQIKSAIAGGFVVNLSCNSAHEAAKTYREHNLPTVTLLPIDAPNVQSVEGVKVVACPAEKSDRVTCSTCGLCAQSDRGYVIGFRAHGTKKRAADIIATGG